MPHLSCIVLTFLFPIYAIALERLEGVRLVEHPSNDGDSFMVSHEGTEMLLRLYWVDTPETSVSATTDARRVVEQARYFGVEDPREVIAAGQRATEVTHSLLSEPFTVYTAFANAPGRSTQPRLYAFVVTADGHDLGETLVRTGHARVGSMRRTGWRSGETFADTTARYNDREVAAQLGRRGVWALSNPDLLPLLREQQRAEERTLRELTGTAPPTTKLSVNSATAEELQSIPGIGPALAQQIIEHRPFPSAEDIRRVPGIGDGRWEQWRHYLKD